ncbi:Peptidoglycan/xylan/chitin deacetylase, PgdA/CDA1 family [Lentibacillus persicus]|uniref:Peptidoglycan/xylan/chitin deacetylase, PgdA/CDA1 family n=1 Tax=Lentibacillus persicus TaxID=640948 RepID=A0A1I1VSI7_9BACI|nr:polysaccharide deacetylase family protein [Lentibacillus persicus]SFD83500.1 Peptidoglycan/xylan/chitin deacetylase, PgdA/CDA1 family [Lentibacillus persicus]
MKNIAGMIMLTVVFLTACGDLSAEDETNSEGSEQNTPQEKTEKNKDDQEKSKEEGKPDEENAAEKKNQQDESESSEEKPVETLYQVDSETSSIVPVNEEATEKAVLLTIDDVPDSHALDMARTLKDLNAGAIFFVNGHFLKSQLDKDVLKQIKKLGFEIGNHTDSHPFLPDLPREEQKNEIVTLSDEIEDIIGERPKFFRAPNGANTEYSKKVAENEGMVVMNWTYGYDYFEPYMDAEKLTEAMVTGKGPEVDVPHSLLKPGANLLMHDREWTAAALEDIVAGLRDKGYKIADPKTIKTID